MEIDEFELYAARLSDEERKSLSDGDFALPSKRMFPIKDRSHVLDAWRMLPLAKGLTSTERTQARLAILHKAKEFGIDTTKWHQHLTASAVQFSFSDVTTNPNRMPFTGVLTYLDVPSDQPPGGSGGRKVLIPSAVGIPALDSLKGMGVNLAAEADDHAVTHKIGVITDAYVGQLTAKGLEVIVEGHIFARDFPREASMVKLNQSNLGFSYETANTLLASQQINGEDVAVTEALVFTGAAILLKKAAAYQSTSIAASSNPLPKGDTTNVTAEEMKALFGEFQVGLLAAVDTKLEAAMKSKKIPAQDAADSIQMEDVEDPEEEDATGIKPESAANVQGDIHAAVAKAVAEALKTAGLSAAAPAPVPPVPPQRKSFDSGTLMAKYNVDATAENVYTAIDAAAEKAGLSVTDRIALKLEAMRAAK